MQHDDEASDAFHEECGVFGIIDHKDAAAMTALGLHALQHRGQEAAGIVTCDGRDFYERKQEGLVGDRFTRADALNQLKGDLALGHVRYATTGASELRNVQPFYGDFAFGGLALAHNGNLTNALKLRRELVEEGSMFHSTADTEVLVHLIARERGETVSDRIIKAMRAIEGAWSLVAMTADTLIGIRDPLGIRPLVMGRLDSSVILCSETCALDIIGAEFVREIEPGEMVIFHNGNETSLRLSPVQPSRFCIFEYVYFARPDSVVGDQNVYNVRKNIGAELAKESAIDADLVVPIPDSGVPAAIGYAQQAGLPFELGIIRNHYVGRTFIEPTDRIRHLGVKLKHNPNIPLLKGKRVILVDDSIVRGTTSKKIVEMVRWAGASEVHMCIASPPTISGCFYGVDTPDKEKLLAAQHDNAAMCEMIGADSLQFITMDGLYRAAGETGRDPNRPQYCDACFSGEYPTKLLDYQAEGDAGEQQTSLLALVDRKSS